MFKLLTRFAWIISYIIGFIITFSLAGFLENTNFRGEEMIIVLIFTVIFGAVIKKLYLSAEFIQERLEVFADGLVSIIQSKKKTTENIETISLPLQEKVEIKQEAVIDLEDVPQSIETVSEAHSTDYEDQEKDDNFNSEPSALAIYIKKFFSENLLAKIGSILVFLGVVFLMSLIWNQIPATLKIILGFAIGFGTYFTGVKLDKKGYAGEARILLGTGVLINFLVILAGKYIFNFNLFNLDPVEMGFIATGITLLFLVLNTIFGVVTSLVYKSRTLLLFSFIFAYINPFLTGGTLDSPYTLVGYSMIVSLGALYTGIKQNDYILKISAFGLGNILFLLAPFQTEIGWITILVSSAILGFITILHFAKSDSSKVPAVFITNYIFIILLLIIGGDNNIISGTSSFISYMISILFFFGIGIWLFMKEIMLGISSILIFPILIILGLVFTGTIPFIAPALAIVVLAYLVGFNSVQSSLSPILKYVFFGLLGGFIFMVNSFFSISTITLDLPSFITVIVISFIFLFTSYYLSCKKNSEFLYTIGTLGGIFMLAPVLIVSSSFPTAMGIDPNFTSTEIKITISYLSVIIFALSNIILPFINKQLTTKDSNIKNLIIGSIFGILFIGFQLFNYGEINFPGISLGLAFGIGAILYFILSYMMMNKIGVEEMKTKINFRNIVYSYLFISISLFSLSIALVFSNNPEIISTVWLFEATILFYFYNQSKEDKIGTLGIILFIIGILQLFDLSVDKSQFLFLIPLSLIFVSFVLNIKYLDDIKNGTMRVVHDLFHILGIGVIAMLILDIIPSTGHGWSVLGISLFILILGYIYSKFSSGILKVFFITAFTLFTFSHFNEIGRMLRNIDNDKLSYLRVLQYSAFAIISYTVFVWNKVNLKSFYNSIINSIFILYTLVIVSYFVFDIFSTTFAITIFWGIVSSIYLFYGISSEKIKIRTIGLYLLTLVLGKIFIFDIWNLDDAVTRVIALMVIGILLIVISIKYTSKYGNNLVGEFDIKNLFTDKYTENTAEAHTVEYNEQVNINSKEHNTSPLVNKHIEDIDISDIDSVKFYPNGDKNFMSKAKNLKKIVRMILEEKPCGTFAPNELMDTYNYVVKNYKSELSKRDFDMIDGAIQNFVKKGGKVEIKK